MRTLGLFGRAAIAGALVAIPPSTPVALSQQPGQSPQAPRFRASTTVIDVDVVVQDRDGKFVHGLEADDLEVFEDGKRQSIQQFYYVSHDPSAGAMPETGVAPQTAQRGRRVFLFFFDEAGLSPDSLMRVQKGAETFISQRMGPGDLGGVFVGGALHQNRVSADRASLLAAVKSAKPITDHRQALLASFREFPRVPGELDAVRIADGTASELALRIAQQNCKEDAVQCQYAGGVAAVDNLIERKSRLYVGQARVQTDRTMKNLRYVIDGLGKIPGRKTLIMLTEGFFIEEVRSSVGGLAALAARGGTAIYSIDGRGLTTGMGANPDVTRASMARSTEFDTGDTGPVIFSQGTGGLSFRNIDDISRALNLVAADTSTYYVLGYSPANIVWDGKFRKIEVKARVPGLKIRARKGYAAVRINR